MLPYYVDTVHRKRLPNSATASFETTEAVQLLISVILQFFMAVSWSFSPPLDRITPDGQRVSIFFTKF